MRNITLALIMAVFLSLASMGTASHARPAAETPNPTQSGDGCGEAAGIEAGATYIDVCATQAPLKVLSTPMPTQSGDGCGEAVGIEICAPGKRVVAQGIRAASGFTYNGIEVVPSSIPIAAGSGAVDTDMDGCSDSDEIIRGLDPNNGLDWLDHHRDGVINVIDAQVIAFRIWTTPSDPHYKLYYDRSQPGGGIVGPADGYISVPGDLQQLYSRFGDSCPPVYPWPDEQAICNELALEAASEGVDNFTCGSQGLPAGITTNTLSETKKIARVRVMSDSVEISASALTIELESGTTPPPESNAAGGPITLQHPLACETQVCSATLVDEFGVRIIGITCAKITMTSRYKIYAPWAGIFDVQPPLVESDIVAPCSQTELTFGQIDNSPFWAENWTRWAVVGGIPSPWGTIGLRSWTREPHTWFNGLFQVDRS